MNYYLPFNYGPWERGNSKITPELTIGELYLYDFQIELNDSGTKIKNKFQSEPRLPGVILTENHKLVGMISRRRFLEKMSQPYGLELFIQRPLKVFYPFVKTDILILPSDTLVIEATNLITQRNQDLFDEPIVVEIKPRIYRLLDIQQLLIVQSKIHQLTTELVKKLYRELAISNKKLERLACLDSLTQVSNRRQFDECLLREWKQMARENQWISLILCDVDYFKLYNDTYGHQKGDECLKLVASTINNTLKRPQDLVARYGGEEFAIILPNTDNKGVITVGTMIREAINNLNIPHEASKITSHVTLSLGVVSLIPLPDQSPEILISMADKALYKAKKKGRDRLINYHDFFKTKK